MEDKAISPTRKEDFPEWYQQVIKAADLAENSPVRGSMVIKPWGYGIWECVQKNLDRRIKETGHENAYFPLFIPLSFLEKEATHVEGFAKECAVVTHHRLEEKEGKLIPAGELDEPLIVRPTSETLIADAFSRWIESYRDLPILINQWANVCRWEMRTRMFLRTTEFLWQEGHTAHETKEEAIEETLKMLYVYQEILEDYLAIPTILGEKSPGEKFPGAVSTYTIELLMQDRKALQGCTSHYLGQNFSKSSNISFSTRDSRQEYAYTTSWGLTTRVIGGMIMTHGDDDGARIPPKVAPKHVVILPIIPKETFRNEVLAYAELIKKTIASTAFDGIPIIVTIDDRDRRGGEKNWEWIKKGIPLRIEVGPKDLEKKSVLLARRDRPHKEKEAIPLQNLAAKVPQTLKEIQENYFHQALQFRDQHTYTHVKTMEHLIEFFTPSNPDKPEIHGGFVKAKWCGDPTTEELLAPHKLTIRCILLNQSNSEGKCILTGRPATLDVLIAKSY